ncbi:MAG: hypothetical protein ACT4PV_07635 [Planctomycetaceae bacterium]
MRNKRFLRAGVTSMALLLVLAGAAYALQTQTAPLPIGSNFAVATELVPGTGGDGSIVCGGGTPLEFDDDLELNIRFGADGEVIINGEEGPSFIPGNRHRADLNFRKVDGIYRADILIRDLDTAQTIYSAMGVDVSGTPSVENQVVVSGDAVTLLSVVLR